MASLPADGLTEVPEYGWTIYDLKTGRTAETPSEVMEFQGAAYRLATTGLPDLVSAELSSPPLEQAGGLKEIRVIADPALPDRDWYLMTEEVVADCEGRVDLETMKLAWGDPSPAVEPDDPYRMEFDALTFQIRQQFAVGAALLGNDRNRRILEGYLWPSPLWQMDPPREWLDPLGKW